MMYVIFISGLILGYILSMTIMCMKELKNDTLTGCGVNLPPSDLDIPMPPVKLPRSLSESNYHFLLKKHLRSQSF